MVQAGRGFPFFILRLDPQALLRYKADRQPPSTTLRCTVPLSTQRTGRHQIQQQPTFTSQQPPIDALAVQLQLALARASLRIEAHHQRTMHVLSGHFWFGIEYQLKTARPYFNTLKHDRLRVAQPADHQAHHKTEQRKRGDNAN